MESILKRFTWVAAALFVLGMCGAARAETSEEARAYFQNGVELLTETPPNYQDAYYQFKLAYEKSGKNWKVLGNLGLCAMKLERDAEAIAYYSEYIEKGASDLQEEETRQIKRDLLLLKGNLAQVEIDSEVADLELSAARVGSSAPAQIHKLSGGKLALSLRAGTQKITANRDGKPQVWEVTLAPGDVKTHTFSFAAEEGAVSPSSAPQRGASASSSEQAAKQGGGMGPLRIAGIATTGVGVGALIAGGIFGLSATKQEGKARDQADDPNVCRESGAGDTVCANSAEGAFDKARNSALLSNIFFIGGGVLATAGVTMIILGGKSEPDESAATLQLSPAVLPLGGGLSALGRF